MGIHTAWGKPMTFSWELEGTSARILQWFGPTSISVATWKGYSDKQRVEWFQQQAAPRWHQQIGDGGLSYRDFQNVDGPPWAKLTQEIWPVTWEMQCTSPFPDTLDALFQQLDFVRQKFPSATNDFQVHIAFALPSDATERKMYSGLLVALFSLLNDYAAAKIYRRDAEVVQDRYYGAATVDSMQLWDKLLESKPIEADKASGYKFNFVGLRQTYDDPAKVGLEIREGWSKSYDRFKSLLTRVVSTLSTMRETTPHAVKASRVEGAAEFGLFQHLSFLNAEGSGEDIGQPYDDLLAHEAVRVIDAAGERIKKQPYPHTDVTSNQELTFINTSADVLLKRWRKVLLRWELHPALASDKNMQTTIVAARTSFKGAVSQYLNAVKDQVRPPDDGFVHGQVKQFFAKTSLYKYL